MSGYTSSLIGVMHISGMVINGGVAKESCEYAGVNY